MGRVESNLNIDGANKMSRKRILNKSKHEKHHQNENIKFKALPKMEI